MLTDESMVYHITGDYTVMLDSSHKYMWKCAITTKCQPRRFSYNHVAKEVPGKKGVVLRRPYMPEAESPNRHWWVREKKTSTQRLLQQPPLKRQHGKIIVSTQLQKITYGTQRKKRKENCAKTKRKEMLDSDTWLVYQSQLDWLQSAGVIITLRSRPRLASSALTLLLILHSPPPVFALRLSSFIYSFPPSPVSHWAHTHTHTPRNSLASPMWIIMRYSGMHNPDRFNRGMRYSGAQHSTLQTCDGEESGWRKNWPLLRCQPGSHISVKSPS